MKDINKVVCVGRLTRDAELKYSNSGTAVLKFGIAVNESKKNPAGEWEDHPNFFDVVMFGKLPEAIHKFLWKGTRVTVAGRLQQERWENSEGQNRSKVSIVGEDIYVEKSNASPSRSSGSPGDTPGDDVPF